MIHLTSFELSMVIIKPMSDFHTKARTLARLAHETNEPIFFTEKGEGDLVLMSMDCYNKIQLQLDLYGKLDESEQDFANGSRGKPYGQVMRTIRKRLRQKAHRR